MIFDLKHYNRPNPQAVTNTILGFVVIIALLLILGWMGERDRQHHLTQIKTAMTPQCG